MLSPDFLIVPNTLKGLDASARWVTLSGGRRVQLVDPAPVSMKDSASVQQAADERNKSRVMQFAKPGEDSDIDKQVKMTTNTTRNGQNANGTLRIEISDATKRTLYERPMSQLPQLVAQLASKGYELHTQFYRSLKNVVKAAQDWGLTDSQASERGTLRTLLVSRVHHAYTTACDQLSMRGYLSQEQRMKVTNAFGAALKFLNENLDSEVAALPISEDDLSDIANTQKAMDAHAWYTVADEPPAPDPQAQYALFAALILKWQSILMLDEWEITFAVKDLPRVDQGIVVSWSEKRAEIELSSRLTAETAEDDIAHELMHLVLYPENWKLDEHADEMLRRKAIDADEYIALQESFNLAQNVTIEHLKRILAKAGMWGQ